MTSYAVARLDEIEEVTDGREPFRPVRHHFGISSFGVNAWTARGVGDRRVRPLGAPRPVRVVSRHKGVLTVADLSARRCQLARKARVALANAAPPPPRSSA
jgi:hypothetical protein